MASQLKRQLLAMNAKNSMQTNDQTSTNSKSTKGSAKNGGTTQYFTKDKTGFDRSALPKPAKKSVPTSSKKVVFNKPQPTGKAAPKGKNPGKGPGKMTGRTGSLWSK